MNDRANNSNTEPDDADLLASPAFVEALRRLEETQGVAVPAERDGQILSKCHEALVQRLKGHISGSMGGKTVQDEGVDRAHEPATKGGAGTLLPAFDGQPKGGIGERRPTFRSKESSSQAERPDEIPGDELMKREAAGSRILRIPFHRLRWAAAAAIFVLAFASAYWARRPGPDVAINIERPTIVDVFALARRVEAGHSIASRFDLNNDGRIDETDVDLLAQKAVALPEGGAL